MSLCCLLYKYKNFSGVCVHAYIQIMIASAYYYCVVKRKLEVVIDPFAGIPYGRVLSNKSH